MGELKKVLSFKVMLLITINSIIGSGMFFLPSIAAKYSGPASIISWIILSGIAIYTAMIFSELIAMYPKAGGIYEFSKQAYGRFSSFIIGWMAWLVGNITTAMLIVGAIQYILPYNSPEIIAAKIVFCLFWVGVFNFMTYRGMKMSSFMLVTFAIITLSVIFLILIPSLFHFDPGLLEPFFIHSTFFKNFSFIFLSIFFISEAFFGLESVTFLAEETKDPTKTLPKALIGGTIIIAILTILLVTVTLGVLYFKQFGSSSAPFADVADIVMGGFGRDIVTIGTYLVIIGAAAGWIVSGPRLILALTRDKLFLPSYKKIHPKYGTPYKAIWFQAIATSIFILLAFRGEGYKTLLSMLIPMVLIMMSAVILTVTILRIKKPDVKRPYKAPFPYVGPSLLIIFNLFLIFMWISHEGEAWYLLRQVFSLIFIGLPIYFLLEMYYNPRAVRKTNNALAYAALFTERMMLPMKVRKEIIKLIGNIKGKTILEFGCSIGTMTLHLAEEVGKYGQIYATDISERDISIVQKRINKKGHKHIILYHDPDHHKRVHPKIPKVHVIVSVGMLGYIENPTKVLRHMNRLLQKGSKICFVDYDKLFDIIPNIEWITDDEAVKTLFKNCGFDIKIKRKQGFAWKYIYIYGQKKKDV